ncbi:chorismate-binding protein [Candidatus Pelagibacter sp.]|uniref:chorismate-binding protein n=1 Tax=uncultured Candidatus Pelagibacter sp. TaxID=372654 RepID=UPI0023390FD6|nr:chorismate-binding protein [uncultured Candidatus Pelagibacter sp.]MDB3947062.1 chorismate-binding protein [Candidatus Pelagibacter sp.]MDB4351616.1 chorismate-binding protein [Candidatus Pelagibacter sp.]MDB4811677.1 chorismate-binding protein [Candidatus Pelagibacter sp.]MDC1077038.1 chorismate-binding protein [Candidatus Pelagibacter sp.]
MNKKNYLNSINNSQKPFIIYKTIKGFDLFTDFSKKIILNNQNIKHFLNQNHSYKKKYKSTDLYIGFFGYELLNNLIGVKVPRQKSINFPKGIFYKPETIINLKEDLIYEPQSTHKIDRNFKINIDQNSYTKIFDKFKKKIRSGQTYQIKICTKYKNKSKIDPLDFFCRLAKTNLAPEAFMIKDKNYSIISCSPENLINKKGPSISTKPIAGTLRKTKNINKRKALNFFKNNIKETKEHNMIVDMERNDLSRICIPGSVKLKKEKSVEEYKDLYHYVSLISGKLKKKVENIDIIKAMMPGGSVIGCPKISTLNLLNKQEKENRNIYTGSFGYIKFNGDMKFNIIIRSILNYKNISEISVASGVVIDSNAKHEFNENFIKAKALIDLFK